jgi:GpV Apex motif
MSNDTVFGTQTPQVEGSDYNTILFAIRQELAKVNTCSVVQVVAATNDGDISPAGTVDVQPLVNQMTGNRIAVPHLRVYRLPYVRWQGGANAVILDPQPGDIGIVVCSQRDITSVKTAKGQANPGSFRMFNWADAIYIGGILNGTPTQYVAFTPSGLTVVSTSKVTIQAPAIELDGDVTITGTTTGDGDGTFDGISVKTHVHSGVTTGSGDTGPPV